MVRALDNRFLSEQFPRHTQTIICVFVQARVVLREHALGAVTDDKCFVVPFH